MKYKKLIFAFALWAIVIVCNAGLAGAQLVIDFENGSDGAVVSSPYPEIAFTPSGGSNWVYGDWRATVPNGEPKYNGKYPDNGAFYSEGNFFANMGPNRDRGRITLNFNNQEFQFSIGYSAAGPIILEAYDFGGNLIDSDSGDVNTNTGQLDFLMVEGFIAYVEIDFLGNHWLIDNIQSSEVIRCTSDEECDDQAYCNGQEVCLDGECAPGVSPECDDGIFCNGIEKCDELADSCEEGTPPNCADDGIFCNGPEICSDEESACISAGNPCQEDEICDEDDGRCMASSVPTPPPGWPEGEITGGCCGC